MNNHTAKMKAPIIITVLVIAYYFLYFGIIIHFVESLLLKLLIGIIPCIISIVMIGVCIQRIREIKSGEEDDLEQY